MNLPRRYSFVLSLPERVIRALGGLSGGLLREIGEVAFPERVRRTALYRTMVEITLRFLIEQVGHVPGIYPPEGQLAKDFLLKRGASHGIELLGLLTLHVSPIWVLAALADATGAGHSLIQQISQALQKEGLLEPGPHFASVEQLLDGLEKTSAHLAETMNLPPLNVAGLREEWSKLRAELPRIPARNLPTPANLERVWTRLVESAAAQNRSVFMLSSMLAVSAISEMPGNFHWLSRAGHTAAKHAGEVVGQALLSHYSKALEEISELGFLEYWRRRFRPYLRAAAEQFAHANESSTERVLRNR